MRGNRAERIVRALIERIEESAERRPTDESEPKFGAMLHRMFRIGMRRRELVLHGDQAAADNAARKIDLLVIHTGDARIFDHAFVEQLFQRAALVFVRHRGVGAMRIQQVERIDAQVQRGLLGVTNHGFGAGVGNPTVAAAFGLQTLALRAALISAHRMRTVSGRDRFASTAIPGFGGDEHFISGAIPRSERITHQLFAVPQIFRSTGARLTRQII